MLGIVVSRADRASEHIGEHLQSLADWERRVDSSRPDPEGGGTVYRTDDAELREFDGLHLYLDDVAEAFDDVDLLVFASRHSGETGPLLTAHHTGNFGPAEHGGEAGSLARACPNAHAEVLSALGEYAPPDYEVGMECTHHGPSSVGAPSMFVEVGSDEDQWDDPGAARAVARAILDLVDVAPDRPVEAGGGVGGDETADAAADDDRYRRHLVGFGGGHYTPRFERIVRETDWAVGHVAADWALDTMGMPSAAADVVARTFEQSRASYAVVAENRPALTETIEAEGYRVVGESWVRAVAGVPLPLVDRLETTLVGVDEGLRFGDPARDADPDVSVETVTLPTALVERAEGIDGDRTRRVVAEAALAFETEENGARLGARAALVSGGGYDRIVDGLLDVLGTHYDDVQREADTVIARKTAFDPAEARELGVPEGPKFGRLADGEPVDINGDTVDPAQVTAERVDTFPL
jgi:D-aminoacyl-tRNA deacylase